MKSRSFAVIALLVLAPLPGAPPAAGEAMVAGWIETVVLPGTGLALTAKMDTGARHSSLTARDIATFRRDGDDWVRFVVRHRAGKSVTLEAPLARTARIRRHGGKTQTRPAVRMRLCLGTVAKETEVNLVDRTGFNYPLLVGRSFLAGDFVIDAGAKRLLEPRCPGK